MARKQVGATPSGATDAARKGDVDAKIVDNSGTAMTVLVLTQAQYAAIGSPSSTVAYIVTP